MVETLLVNSYPVEAGRELLRRLDDKGWKITDAYWRYSEDLSAWRLNFVTPLVNTLGRPALFAEIRHILDEFPSELRQDLQTTDISLNHPQQTVVEDMRRSHRGVTEDKPVATWRTPTNPTAPYIYRLLPTSSRRKSATRSFRLA